MILGRKHIGVGWLSSFGILLPFLLAMLSHSAVFARATNDLEPVPLEEVPVVVHAVRAQLYCFFVLVALLIWDSGKSTSLIMTPSSP